MQTRVLLGLGTGLAALAALPGYSQSSNDAALEAACRATEVTMPDSCPCTLTKARAVGVTDAELASLFKDDGHSQPVDPAQYGKFWQVKSQCIADTMMASMGISASNPLPGVPANMRPGMPLPGAAPAPAAAPPPPPTARRDLQPPASASASATRRDLQQPASAQSAPGKAAKRSVADVEAMIARLADTAWEYTDENGDLHRYDFLPDDNIMVYQAGGQYPFTDVAFVSAIDAEYGAQFSVRTVNTGSYGDLPILSVSGDTMVYQRRYVRTGEEWNFRKVGRASAVLPDSAPEQLEDGFWRVPYDPGSKNQLVLSQQQLLGTAGPANRTLSTTDIAGKYMAGFLIGDESREDCNSNCFFIVNDFDWQSKRLRNRVIKEVGVDHVGVRPEPSGKDNNVVSVRAYDGYGGWKEWRCAARGPVSTARIACEATGSKDAPQARPSEAEASSGGLLAKLRPVQGELYGEAQCNSDLYFLPSDGQMPASIDAAFAHIRTHDRSLFATTVTSALKHPDGWELAAKKINFAGTPVVLDPQDRTGSGNIYGDAALSLRLTPTGVTLNDPMQPAFGFSKVRVEITAGADSESFEALEFSGC